MPYGVVLNQQNSLIARNAIESNHGYSQRYIRDASFSASLYDSACFYFGDVCGASYAWDA